ncbi:MAG: holin [Clostridium sp.]|nr:holin [Clostridium sp.]
MVIDMTQVIVALIGLVGVILSSWLIPLLRSKTTEQKWENAMFWVRLAVKSAEQIYNQQGWGEAKKKYVEEFLKEHNIKLDDQQVDVAIEAAVLEIQKAAG